MTRREGEAGDDVGTRGRRITLSPRLKSVLANGAVRSAGMLVGGTAVAQLLAVIALPFLTRLYSPADFTVLAVYSALLAIVSIAATARYNMGIPLPESDEEAANLLMLSTVCSLITALLSGGLLWLFGAEFARAASIEEAEPFFWLLPISIFLSGSFLGFQNWWVRRKAFGNLAMTRFSQVLAGVSVQLGMGILGMRPLGLLVGQMLVSGAGSVKLMRDFWLRDRHLLRSINSRTLWRTAKKHSQFPKYSVADALAANAGTHVPLIIIAGLAVGPEAGLLLLTMRVLGAPVQLIAGAVAQVYLSNVGKAHQEGRLQVSVEKLVTALSLYGAAPLLFGSFAAVPLFGIVFGAEWADAGQMMMWVAPWYAFRMLGYPIVSVAAVLSRQRVVMVTRIASLIIRIAAVYIGFYYWDGRAVEALAISGIAHNLFFTVQSCWLARVRVRKLGIAFVAVPIAAGLLGVLVAQLISFLLP